MIRAAFILALLLLTECDRTARSVEYEHYINERSLYAECRSGTRVYKWHDQYWVNSSRWPDMPVVDPDKVCQWSPSGWVFTYSTSGMSLQTFGMPPPCF